MGEFGIGQPVRRFEDKRLLSGNGRFQNDNSLLGQAYAYVLRSPHAHARIRALDLTAAKAAPGVALIMTGDDLVEAKLGIMGVPFQRKRPDGSPMFARAHLGLAQDTVRYVGEPVAFVVAETLAQAKDAAELIDIDYEALPSVTDTAEAAEGKIAVWDECPDNISNLFEAGNKAATEAAFAKAAHIVKRRYVISRVYAHFMEPRGAIGVWDPGEERFTLYADVQYPHRVRQALATRIFKIPESKIRVIAGDVGGGFGTKGWQYPEHRLVLLAAKKLRRPVKWTCERSEAIQADEHARDNVSDAELALDEDGKFLGLRVKTLANVGAYISSERNLLATFGNVGTLAGVYRHPGGPCRGAGGDGQHQRHRALSRRRPARGDLCHRAADRRCGARTGLRPHRIAHQEPDPRLGDAVQDRAGPQLRLRRFPRQPAEGAGASRLGRLSGAPRRSQGARQAARHRHRQPDREGGGTRPGIRRDPLSPERQRDPVDGQQEPGPGPRDHLQAGAQRKARARSQRSCNTSTATPTASPSASAPTAHARR